MKKKPKTRIFVFFFAIGIIVIFFSYFNKTQTLRSLVERRIAFINRWVVSNFAKTQPSRISSQEKTAEKSAQTTLRIQKLEDENRALRDQFQTPKPDSSKLLPSNIIGRPSFIPGVSAPEYIVIDRGVDDGIQAGQVVVYKDNVVGKVGETSKHLSRITLVASKKFSETVKIVGENSKPADGVIKGQGNGHILLDNVLLSQKIAKGDVVVSRGSEETDSTGIPPDLKIGTIYSIEKNPSALFQSASVESFVDTATLSVVFVLVE